VADGGAALRRCWRAARELAEDACAFYFLPEPTDRLSCDWFALSSPARAPPRYAFNGTWLGTEELDEQFYYCHQPQGERSGATERSAPSFLTDYLKFGNAHDETYSCDLPSLMKQEEPVMYDLYLVDEGNTGSGVRASQGGGEGGLRNYPGLFPVPVRNLNLREGSVQVNKNSRSSEEADDQFTRRFFLWDKQTAQETAGQPATVLRYASKITLKIKLQKDAAAKIYPPLLEIEYTERPTEAFTVAGSGMATAALQFRVEYTMDTSAFWYSMTALWTVCCVLCFGVWMLRVSNYQRRYNNNLPFDFSFMCRMAVFLARSFTDIFFWLVFAVCTYWFVFFKMQASVYLCLPPFNPEFGDLNEYYAFKSCLYVFFFFQLLHVCEILYTQCTADVFLIDWEKENGELRDQESRKSVKLPISVWRTLFAANEWNELQTTRKTNVSATLLLLAFLLRGCSLEYLGVARPNISDLSKGEFNLIIRFWNTTFWWLLISYGQRLLTLIHVRVLKRSEPAITTFIDVCTVAKISVLVMDEKYHGYYLHCNLKYPQADCNMQQMTETLHHESQGSVPERGLHVWDSRFEKDVQVQSTPRTAHRTPHTAHRTPHTAHRTPHTAYRALISDL
jgi:meckelin